MTYTATHRAQIMIYVHGAITIRSGQNSYLQYKPELNIGSARNLSLTSPDRILMFKRFQDLLKDSFACSNACALV